MGSESIAFGLMGYWLRDHEGERNNCFNKFQLVGQNIETKQLLASKARRKSLFVAKNPALFASSGL